MGAHITERACAKLNLSLDVLGKLPGGYHSLCMIMESVSLCDTLEISLRRDGVTELRSNLPWLPRDSRNLAVEAVRVFREKLGDTALGANIALHKTIPVGAGMAGGSTDGAAMLRALNTLTGHPFDADGLREMALSIGSDVPYCVQGGSFLAKGRGEELSPLPMPPDCAVVIAKPTFSISTGTLFGLIDARNSRTRPDTAGMIAALESGDLPGMARRMYNVFEDVLPRNCGEVLTLRSELLDSGALGAVMTGTGSAVFGIYENAAKAADGAERLRSSCRDVFVTEFVPAAEI